MPFYEQPRVFGTGLIALDLVYGPRPESPVRAWAGGTCGNVLSILAYLGWEAFPIARLNNNPASIHVQADFRKWRVHLDFVNCEPTAHTPIIVQEIRHGQNAKPEHRFVWRCPKCERWLPTYKPVTIAAIDIVRPAIMNASAFFFDRLSRGALSLAKEAANRGAAVVFEPSGWGRQSLMAEAIGLAHIVKYSDQRMSPANGFMDHSSSTLVEIQTLGERGLRYRHRFGHKPTEWMHLGAITAPRLADSCGAGDWATAGLLAKATAGGLDEMHSGGANGLQKALRYGQALAAWNCGFEGARGGMYAVTRDAFDVQIDALLAGRVSPFTDNVYNLCYESLVHCPACPPDPEVPRTVLM